MNHQHEDHHQHHQHDHQNHNQQQFNDGPLLSLTSKSPSDEAGRYNNKNKFCDGTGSIMFMDGFHSSLMEKDMPCLNFLFPNWTLDTTTKFIFALFATAFLGYITEVVALRCTAIRRMSHGNNSTTISLIHVLQAFLGYIDMILVMTLSYEIIASLLFGFWLGFYQNTSMQPRKT